MTLLKFYPVLLMYITCNQLLSHALSVLKMHSTYYLTLSEYYLNHALKILPHALTVPFHALKVLSYAFKILSYALAAYYMHTKNDLMLRQCIVVTYTTLSYVLTVQLHALTVLSNVLVGLLHTCTNIILSHAFKLLSQCFFCSK